MTVGRVLRTAGALAGACWRRYWRAGVASLAALAGLALVTLGPAGAVAAWHAYTERQPPTSAAHYVGDRVPEGPITFVVHEVRCGAAGDSTHGQRCEVTLGARNEGADEVTVPVDAQTLHAAKGARHQPTAARAFDPLEPRRAATAVLEYDLPLRSTVTHVEVRADTYSRGVPVAVGDPYPLVTPG